MASEITRAPARSHSVPPTDRTSCYSTRYSPQEQRTTNQTMESHPRLSRNRSPQYGSTSSASRDIPFSLGNGMAYNQYTAAMTAGNALNNGFPPNNFLLSAFLTGGHYPLDFRGPWMQHQKHHNWGAWNGNRGYHKSSWGPVF
ncbi:hypothetical protein L596_022318 [Steinernema carpocapsae]|uniref:Uncharacterized protein n=1 Tax=Steinernema carpocapsae TaxID=34508 RepID=A0A4U5MLF7_STECR|nr:hypothetical protein L596_022318 [Steinernema carpocapsae]